MYLLNWSTFYRMISFVMYVVNGKTLIKLKLKLGLTFASCWLCSKSPSQVFQRGQGKWTKASIVCFWQSYITSDATCSTLVLVCALHWVKGHQFLELELISTPLGRDATPLLMHLEEQLTILLCHFSISCSGLHLYIAPPLACERRRIFSVTEYVCVRRLPHHCNLGIRFSTWQRLKNHLHEEIGQTYHFATFVVFGLVKFIN